MRTQEIRYFAPPPVGEDEKALDAAMRRTTDYLVANAASESATVPTADLLRIHQALANSVVCRCGRRKSEPRCPICDNDQ